MAPTSTRRTTAPCPSSRASTPTTSYVALKSYKIENNAQLGRSNGVMSGQAKKYTNDELKELASYVSSLPGELKTVPESRLHHPR